MAERRVAFRAVGGTHTAQAVIPPALHNDIDRPELWFFDLSATVDVTVLAADEFERAARFRFERDRARFVARRAQLRHVLASYTDCPPQALRFTVGRFGKPALVEHRHLAFSTSSSGDDAVVAVGAVGSGELGVDLERVGPHSGPGDLRDVAERFFAAGEIGQLRSPADFYRCWSRKEAYVKAIGQGLSFPLDSFAVEVADVAAPRLLHSVLRPQDVDRVQMVDLSASSGDYMAALVVLTAGVSTPVEPERRFTHEL